MNTGKEKWNRQKGSQGPNDENRRLANFTEEDTEIVGDFQVIKDRIKEFNIQTISQTPLLMYLRGPYYPHNQRIFTVLLHGF